MNNLPSNYNIATNQLSSGRVATYCRVSTSEQATEGYSLDAQAAALTAYAKQRQWTIWDTYTDAGFSGGIDQRPELQRLMHDAAEHRFDTVIVCKLDRFFRNTRLLLNYLYRLDQLGIKFISTQEGLDTSTPNGKFSLQIMGSIADFERGRIGERVRDVRRHLAALHQWSSGRTPFGYRFNKEAKELELHQSETEVVQFMFTHYLSDNLGLIRLAELMNREQKLTPRFGQRQNKNLWTQSGVRHILTHPGYKGGPSEAWAYKCPAIVEVATWEAVQKRLTSNQHFKPTVATRREFRGMLRCGLCGHTLRVGYNHNTRPIYECLGRSHKLHLDGSANCTLPRLDAVALDSTIGKEVMAVFESPELFKRHVTETIANLESELKELERRLKPLQAEGDRVKADMEIADTMYKMRRLDTESYKAMVAGLQAKLRDIERRQEGADPLLIRDYNLKKLDLDFCQRFTEEAVLDNLPAIREALFKTLDEKVSTLPLPTGGPIFHQHFQRQPRELLTALGMIGMVFADRVEFKGHVGKSLVTSACL